MVLLDVTERSAPTGWAHGSGLGLVRRHRGIPAVTSCTLAERAAHLLERPDDVGEIVPLTSAAEASSEEIIGASPSLRAAMGRAAPGGRFRASAGRRSISSRLVGKRRRGGAPRRPMGMLAVAAARLPPHPRLGRVRAGMSKRPLHGLSVALERT